MSSLCWPGQLHISICETYHFLYYLIGKCKVWTFWGERKRKIERKKKQRKKVRLEKERERERKEWRERERDERERNIYLSKSDTGMI